MLYGWCRPVNDASLLHELGFDFLECSIVSLHLEKEGELESQLSLYTDSPIPVRAFNSFFPGDMPVVGPSVDPERVRRYIARTADALDRIGAQIAVLGSGKARNIPDGCERARAEEQFLQVLNWIAEDFAGTAITLAIEPLNRKECNWLQTVAEAVHVAKQVNRPEIRVLADFYHMDEEAEPLQTLLENKDWIAHIHLADTGRKSPGTGHYPYESFFAYLKQAGYNGMVSAECKVDDLRAELPASLAFMKKHGGSGL